MLPMLNNCTIDIIQNNFSILYMFDVANLILLLYACLVLSKYKYYNKNLIKYKLILELRYF